MESTCKNVVNLLSDYIDGSLQPDRMWSIKLHLSVCESCSAVASDLEKTVALLQTQAAPTLPAGFDAALAARVAELDAARGKAAHGSLLDKGVYGWRAWMTSMTRGQRMRLAWSTPLLAATFAVVLGLMAPHPAGMHSESPIDPGFTATCAHDHRTFVASQPLADPSAQSLAQHVDSHGADVSAGVAAFDRDGSL